MLFDPLDSRLRLGSDCNLPFFLPGAYKNCQGLNDHAMLYNNSQPQLKGLSLLLLTVGTSTDV